MLDFIKSCLTTSDNKTGDVIRVAFLLTVIVYLTLELINYKTFSATSFGTGVGFLFTTASGALYIKKTTEP